jgi:hypothetical protein
MANRPVDRKTPPRKIAIASKLEELETRNTAKLLGTDGKYVWLLGNSIAGVELASGRVVS